MLAAGAGNDLVRGEDGHEVQLEREREGCLGRASVKTQKRRVRRPFETAEAGNAREPVPRHVVGAAVDPHARASHASVVLRYGDAALALEIVDDGSGHGAGGAGRGIIGMRERAALFDGELVAGPRAERGYAVSATLPLGESGP